MIEISVTGLQKSFDLEKKILDGLTFQINSGERVGLLGKNGAGKTTLFRILTGEIDYDAGEVAIASDRRVGLISQIPVYPAGYTVEDVLQSAFERMRRMADEMERLSAQMANGDESEETLRRYGELSARFEGLGGYDTATAVNKVANGLSIPADMRTRLFDTLSGGEKTRVNLGRLILEDTDILLLDEPTNHLDLHAIEWLEEYLASFKGNYRKHCQAEQQPAAATYGSYNSAYLRYIQQGKLEYRQRRRICFYQPKRIADSQGRQGRCCSKSGDTGRF